jgi:hypothetical protein
VWIVKRRVKVWLDGCGLGQADILEKETSEKESKKHGKKGGKIENKKQSNKRNNSQNK